MPHLLLDQKKRFLTHTNVVGTADTAPVAATLATALTGTNNDITFTAFTKGPPGNSNSVTYVNPGTANAALSMTITPAPGTQIACTADLVISLATNGSSTITTTAQQIIDLLTANANAVRPYFSFALSGGNDGTGVVTALAKTNFTGGTGMTESPIILLPDRPDSSQQQAKSGNIGIVAYGDTAQQMYVEVTYAPHNVLLTNPSAAIWFRWNQGTAGVVTVGTPPVAAQQEYQSEPTAVRLVSGDQAGGATINVKV